MKAQFTTLKVVGGLFVGGMMLNAHAAPELYGYASLGVAANHTKTTNKTTNISTSTTDRPYLYNNTSRIGLRGSEKLNDDYEVLYKLEYRLENDGDLRNEKIKQPDGTEKTVAKTRNFEARDSWIGVKHKKYGTIKAGRMLSLDPYVRYTAYLASGVDGVRTNNTIAYESPKIKDVSFQAMYILDENKETDTIGRDGYSLLVKKNTDTYNVGAAYAYFGKAKTSYGKLNYAARVTGNYKINEDYKVGGIYQQISYANDDSAKNNTEQAVGVTLQHFKDKWTHTAHMNVVNNPSGKKGDGFELIGAIDRDISKNVSAGVDVTYGNFNYETEKKSYISPSIYTTVYF